jgi:hypothetical protein
LAGNIAPIIREEMNVHCSAKNVQNKIGLLESQFKNASDWMNQTGASCTEGEIKDHIGKLCMYYYELRLLDTHFWKICVDIYSLYSQKAILKGLH